MTRNVRTARNTLVGFGFFMLFGGALMLFREPTHWQNWTAQFFGAFFCYSIVRQVNSVA